MSRNKHCTAIVPAYNESRTIKSVILALKGCSYIKQIIVISDGSTDDTNNIVGKLNVELIVNKKNLGKSESVKIALKKAKYDTIFLCDADLVNLTHDICSKIIRPVINSKADMSVGLRNYGKVWNKIQILLISPISGERALKKSTMIKASRSKFFYGFGMEIVMNKYIKKHRLKLKQSVFNYHQTLSTKKIGFISGAVKYLRYGIQLIKTNIAFFLKGWH